MDRTYSVQCCMVLLVVLAQVADPLESNQLFKIRDILCRWLEQIIVR